MATKQIKDFPTVESASNGDFLHLSRGGVDNKITVENLIPALGGFGSVIINTFSDGAEYIAGVDSVVGLTQILVSKNNAWVFFDGIYQNKSTYNVSNNLLTFNEIIPEGVSTIEVVMPIILPLGVTTSADQVQFASTVTSEDLLSQNIVFDNVNAMKNATWLSTGLRCRTLGYITRGDGGGNDYEIVAAATGTDDGGLFIDLDIYQAKGLFVDGRINIKQFGATGNGVTDDLSKIQSAIDSGVSSEIIFTAGDYVISGAISVPDNITLIGVGAGAKITLAASTDASMLRNSDFVGGNTQITVRNLEFDGNRANQGATSNPIILIKNCTNVLFDNLSVHDARITTYTVDTYDQILFVDCSYCTVIDCESYNSDQALLGFYGNGAFNKILRNYVHDGPAGIETTYCDDSIISENIVENTTLSCISFAGVRCVVSKNNVKNSTAAAGIVCGHPGTPLKIADYSSVIDNVIQDVFSYGITVFSSNNVLVHGNKITRAAGNSTHSIFINTGCADVIVSKNHIVDNETTSAGGSGIFVDTCPRAKVIGNMVYGVVGGGTGSGIRLFNSCPDSEIHGNTVTNTAAIGIYVNEAGSTNCSILNNNVKSSGSLSCRVSAVGAIISNNKFSDSSGGQSLDLNADNIICIGNFIDGATVGILTNAVDYYTISSNILSNCSTGINLASGSDNGTVIGNIPDATVTTTFSVGTISGTKIAHNIGLATHTT